MGCRVLDLNQKDEWRKYLKKLPVINQDIHYTPEYYSLFENYWKGKAVCFIFEKDDNFVLYPFLINSINKIGLMESNEEYYDIQGAHGYNGALSTTSDKIFLKEFSKIFAKFCNDRNIILEFTRFNPVFKNHRIFRHLNPKYVQDNIIIDLSRSQEDLWMNSLHSKARRAVKKGIRNNLKVKFYLAKDLPDKLLDKFISIYYSTMKRRGVDKYYFFNKEFFKYLIRLFPDSSLFIFVFKDKKLVSSELSLFSEKTVYAFLGGTLIGGFKSCANSFLRFELIKKFKNMGFINYVLGGGVSKHDSIYQYKKSFSRYKDSKFYIGKKVYNRKVYNKIIEQWKNKFPESYKNNKNRVLGYRRI
jgi:hypothetical protein